MSYYDSLEQEVVDLHYLTRERARLVVIQKIRDCHSRCIPCVKFITGRGNHINATGERGVLYEEFPSWMLDSEIERLVQDYDPFVTYSTLSSMSDYLDYKITYSNTNDSY
ncbi:hypothetical protein GLOIN_2v557442 [Rhizophagus irregularis DAOM 181602=DAOM 197198]|uniref:Smr domain-containing protein n=1 Tax=Rhizophagus irregularis (strain DAOM 181602 / DAOM 197198 / MUCL 43194) TaxID=747089 RepID=A0A2P4QN82_RHIID|nr:hypothetical protein GLOIN_2v557442 [Rhizophagus irregularis DAOM 181602=DAOM 197198]POG79099.1 hypothetical protein GLOIN_2v557442 [Rhizophagus irregularis DAOM 181602=DAOM 197198]|eukprot:XP_025185965.1 hypothetical protein GLOIN_2v557442 [Rhizophagus irregularis DAOM 181602=DAOM 197198]